MLCSLQASGLLRRSRATVLWRAVFSDVGGDLAAAKDITGEMAEEVMSL